MQTRVRKHKLGSTKPVSQLFLFSNKLNGNIDSYFSGNVVIEINLSGYDYKYHEEAKQVVDFMNVYRESRTIEPYKYLTVVINYTPSGLTFATLSGDYEYPIAVHGREGYEQLATLHKAYEALKKRLISFEEYSSLTLNYAYFAQQEPIRMSERSLVSIRSQLERTKKDINKSMSSVLATFHKHFQPRCH